jgi:hypothetical protein
MTPRMPVHIDGTSAAHMVVSDTTITSQASRRCARAVAGHPGAGAEGVEQDLALVVGCAAGQDLAVPLDRIEGR